MPELPKQPTPTVDAIYDHYVKSAGDPYREHLGASIIGNECERAIFYTFRWCTPPDFDGRMYRLFETGNLEESRIVKNLRDVGVTVYDVDPETGKQFHYVDFGGHFSGSCDAIGKGFPEAPETYHILEFKTSNAKGFAQLQSKGVAIAKFTHMAQMQIYMGWAGLDRAFYFCVNKDTDAIYSERVYFDQEQFDRLRLKADRIIFADEPPHKITGDIDHFKCRFCSHKWSCHSTRLPEVNCRTCAFSDVEDDGQWSCTRFKTMIDKEQQKKACDNHCFIPALVPLEVTDASEEKGWIMYGDIINGCGATLSRDMQEKIG